MGAKSKGTSTAKVKSLYQSWLRCPDDYAKQKNGFEDCLTRTAFADKYGVNRSTLYRWEQDKEFAAETIAPIMDLVTPDDIAVSIRALVTKARNGNVGAFNAIAKVYGLDMRTPSEEEDKADEDFFKNASKEELKAYLETFEEGELEGEA